VRHQAVRSGAGAGWGLALVVRQGTAAWMRAWPADAAPPPPPVVTEALHSLPSDLCGQITVVMADMILSHQQQEIPHEQ
jgi:hypothetical protein